MTRSHVRLHGRVARLPPNCATQPTFTACTRPHHIAPYHAHSKLRHTSRIAPSHATDGSPQPPPPYMHHQPGAQNDAVAIVCLGSVWGSGIITAGYLMHDVAGLITIRKASSGPRRAWYSKTTLYTERIIGVGAGLYFGFTSGHLHAHVCFLRMLVKEGMFDVSRWGML